MTAARMVNNRVIRKTAIIRDGVVMSSNNGNGNTPNGTQPLFVRTLIRKREASQLRRQVTELPWELWEHPGLWARTILQAKTIQAKLEVGGSRI